MNRGGGDVNPGQRIDVSDNLSTVPIKCLLPFNGFGNRSVRVHSFDCMLAYSEDGK